MARYIDADAFEQKLADKDIFFPALFKNELNNTPTADVVPKSEVVDIIKEVDSMIELVSAMVGLDIIAFGKYAELKKKYLEGVENAEKNTDL